MKKLLLALVAIDVFLSIINNQKIKKMADNLDDLSTQVDDLQSKLDTVQENITTSVDGLKEVIKDLQDQIDGGGGADTAKIQAISDKITAITADLEATDFDGSDEPGGGEEPV